MLLKVLLIYKEEQTTAEDKYDKANDNLKNNFVKKEEQKSWGWGYIYEGEQVKSSEGITLFELKTKDLKRGDRYVNFRYEEIHIRQKDKLTVELQFTDLKVGDSSY